MVDNKSKKSNKNGLEKYFWEEKENILGIKFSLFNIE